MNGMEYPTSINVFASIAGGTGSGMLIDVLNIVRDALKENAQAYNLYPWIVLPEVFRAMNSGPSMANVLYNSYGALSTLDYIMHHNPKKILRLILVMLRLVNHCLIMLMSSII